MPTLTPQMERALSVLQSTGDRALVRAWSQWWCSESERGRASALGAFHRLPSGEVSGPFNSVAATMNDNPWPVIFVSTATVRALVKRGYLKQKNARRAELI